jgi:uncharacterized protein DUF4326
VEAAVITHARLLPVLPRCGEDAELLQLAEGIKIVPGFDNLAVPSTQKILSLWRGGVMITVVNVKHDKRPEIIYIGHQTAERAASRLGNPYTIKEYTDTIGLYRRWLWRRLQSDTPQRREIERLAQMHRSRQDFLLGCWCAPVPCHGEVVKAAIEWIVRKKAP